MIIIGVCVYLILMLLLKTNVKKWEKATVINIVLLAIFFIATLITNDTGAKTIWEISRTICLAEVSLTLLSFITQIVLTIKNKQVLKLWVKILLALIIGIAIVAAIGKITTNSQTKVGKKYFDTLETKIIQLY